MLWLPRIDEKPYGVWRKEAGKFCITASAIGDFSKKLHELKVGDKIGIRGPFGRGFTIPKKKKVVFIGGGFGSAPLLGLAYGAQDCEMDFLIGARSKNLIFGKKYAQDLGAKVSIATDDGSEGEKGFNTQLLEKLLAEKKIDAAYSCGPELMMKRVAEICAKLTPEISRGIKCELSLERFMKCGIGICGSCVMDDAGFCVCKEGPIIEGEKALKLAEFGKYRRDDVGTREHF